MKISLFTGSILLLFFQTDLSAQNHAISLQTGLIASKITPSSTYPSLQIDNSGRGDGWMLSVQVSQRLYKTIWLNLEGGFMQSTASQEFQTSTGSSTAPIVYLGNYRIQQFYGALEPELRLLKKEWLFVNAGFGLFADRQSEFISGTRTGISVGFDDLTGIPYEREGSLGWYYGFGIRPRVYKNISVSVEARRMQFPSSRQDNSIPTIEMENRNWSFVLGAEYRF